MVVRQTIMSVVLLMTDTSSLFYSLLYMVKMRAKATDPLIVPAIDTIESSLLETVHFYL
jgi:hypothetical protein